ncbi:ATP-dependent DNA helicase RecG [Enterocloster citroniae]|uniref:ATP-dependent DNA helicase RecG n=2 Tax=Enterocloster citroniae TaxID=358743 RepID=A0ABV2FV18_9FIRM|nr:ATP-dependent DNA helicase RecG [Enterocloster citroniae]KMW17215.1 ATP-dependent DNA helicase RecG [[Clostridium] citroniae WAL-19142]
MLNSQPIHSLKGIGEKTGKLFEKLGIFTIDDLFTYYPRAYDAYEAPVPIGQLKEQTVMAVESVLVKSADLLRLNHMQIVSVQLRDLTGSLQVTWFNMPYMRANLKSGETYVFRGRVVKKRGRLVMEQPEVFSPEAYEAVVHSMQPVYGQTRGLSNKTIVRAEQQALEVRKMEREYMPAGLRRKYELAEINYALEHIHFPADQTELLFARKRLVFDEFFMFLVGVRRLKEHREDKRSAYTMERAREVSGLKAKLPYALTGAQERALEEVYRDMESGLVMNRLIQGDVGSGKTIIAILALLQAAYNGYQGALMVPTEVLARQHLESMTALFEEQGISKVPVLVTGSMTAKEKRLAYEKIANHEADIIIGTHALIQEKVIYDNLALVITDEQHRFGVGQREMLSGKGNEPHVLVMSATPIPRTLAIIIYGDLDISVIDELPAGRQSIKNCVVDAGYRPKAYSFIQKQVEEGHQAYVICPMVEASEMIEAENVLDYAKTLRKELPPSIVVEHLHGKMKAKEKNAVMERFAAGEIHVLVSTTVIEVGVNVPNATVMMIENAERFGLAQLHQLRGRVGRGKAQSYCIMVNCSHDESTGERLDILNRSNDGFYIASEDLKLRGPGDIFGMRQSGDMEFKLADIFTDANILKRVSEEVNDLLDADPLLELDEHRELKRKIEDYLGANYEKLNL